MANYVLIHGGDRDGSVWHEVSSFLETQGHAVFCPTMTSVKKASLQDNIDEVIDFIQSHRIEKFILVGHSYGGFVITGVTNCLPTQVQQLIYVDAMVPKNGLSLQKLAEHYGFDYEAAGLTADPAVISPIHFDAKRVFLRPKIYIRCLRSEFIQVTGPVYEDIKQSGEDWLLFCLDSQHGCMFSHPRELAVIFSGAGLFG